MKLEQLSVALAPGNGVLRRSDKMVLFVLGGAENLVDRLEEASFEVKEVSRLVLDQVNPPDAIAVTTPDYAYVFGSAEVHVVHAGLEVVVNGGQAIAGAKIDLGPDVESLRLSAAADVRPDSSLEAGTVPAGGVQIQYLPTIGGAVEFSTAAKSNGASPSLDLNDGAEASAPFVVADLREKVDLRERKPLPVGSGKRTTTPEVADYERPVMVRGLMSSGGHFNHPFANYCRISGERLGVGTTWTPVEAQRPALGVLTFDDGRSYVVKWNTVIGRQPDADYRVASGAFAPLALVGEATMSRCHLAIVLEDWDVGVIDLSANGTHLRRASEPPTLLPKGEHVLLSSGDELQLGDRRCSYYSHYV